MSESTRHSTAAQVNFGRGPRGGPGSRFAQPMEKPKNAGHALKRLTAYLQTEKKLMLGLFLSVVLVTLTSLAAPALQGDGIDRIHGSHYELHLQYRFCDRGGLRRVFCLEGYDLGGCHIGLYHLRKAVFKADQ